MGFLALCEIVTPKNFNLKLCTCDHLGETTHHANFGFNRYSGAFPQIGEILPLVTFLTVLSCPTCSGRNAEPMFTLYGLNDVFPRQEVPLGD